MVDLKGNPFYLDDEGVRWVRTTYEAMTQSEKIGQLFCLIQRSEDAWREEADMLPATLAPELLQDLLRGQLGFNGMIVSDATTMAGMMMPMTRAEADPRIIAAGCDMFLFARNLEEDYSYMERGMREGVITETRLEEAVTRILATKAAIGLHRKQASRTLVPSSAGLSVIGCEAHLSWTRECADQAVTLVKDGRGAVLPLHPERGNRLHLHVIGDQSGVHNPTGSIFPYFKEKLESEGFVADVFEPAKAMELRLRRFDKVVGKYDVILYYCALMTQSNQSTVRISWAPPIGANCPVYLKTVPTLFISMENPYHLLDVPRIRTFINA